MHCTGSLRDFYSLLGGHVAVICLAISGCSPAGHIPTYPVTGKIVFADGTPLQGGMVEFESVGPAAMPINARAAVGPDGTFRLTTYQAFDGAVAGVHRVLVSNPRPPFNSGGPQPFVPVIDRKFERYATSGLKFTVKEETNQFEIVVVPPP